jgi:hypothetical protein
MCTTAVTNNAGDAGDSAAGTVIKLIAGVTDNGAREKRKLIYLELDACSGPVEKRQRVHGASLATSVSISVVTHPAMSGALGSAHSAIGTSAPALCPAGMSSRNAAAKQAMSESYNRLMGHPSGTHSAGRAAAAASGRFCSSSSASVAPAAERMKPKGENCFRTVHAIEYCYTGPDDLGERCPRCTRRHMKRCSQCNVCVQCSSRHLCSPFGATGGSNCSSDCGSGCSSDAHAGFSVTGRISPPAMSTAARNRAVLGPRMDRAVFLAQRTGDFAAALALCEQIPEFVNFRRQAADGCSLLMAAARLGLRGTAQALLARGADPLLADKKGRKALEWAMLARQHDMVSLLAPSTATTIPSGSTPASPASCSSDSQPQPAARRPAASCSPTPTTTAVSTAAVSTAEAGSEWNAAGTAAGTATRRTVRICTQHNTERVFESHSPPSCAAGDGARSRSPPLPTH